MKPTVTIAITTAVLGVSFAIWEWNRELFYLINSNHNPALDRVFGLISGLGDGLVAVVIIMAATLYRTRAALAALTAFLLSGIIAQLLKRLFDMPRPPAVLEQVHLLGAPLRSHSFPSGHATTDGVMALAAILLWRHGKQRLVGWAIALIFLLAAVGRIYGGVHFPQDVWAGVLIGTLTMFVCWHWSAQWPIPLWRQQPWWQSVSGLLLAGLACVLGLGYGVQPATAQPLALLIPVVALFLLVRQWKATPS